LKDSFKIEMRKGVCAEDAWSDADAIATGEARGARASAQGLARQGPRPAQPHRQALTHQGT
jgi:hypothetical protein